jgi:hypothetical protein
VEFWGRVDRSGDCWEWLGPKNQKGYGTIYWALNGRRIEQLAHRASYRLFVGDISEGAVIHHLCENPGCVRPEHLLLVEAGEHSRQHRTLGGTHCKRGHEFTPENTLVRKNGTRWCLACSYERKRQKQEVG